MRKYLPEPNLFIGKRLERYPEHVILRLQGSGNNGHVFLAEDSNINSQIALKFIPLENLRDGARLTEYQLEARIPNQLRHPSVVRYMRAFPWNAPADWETSGLEGREFVVFECEFIDGPSLKTFITDPNNEITISFVKEFLVCMFELLYELHARHLQHGDLHSGNVLVEKPLYDPYGRHRFRITDFGISDFAATSPHRADFLSIATILRDLLNKFPHRPDSSQDRFAFDLLRNDFLNRHLIETDKLADSLAQNPGDLLQKLTDIDTLYLKARDARSDHKLVSPFDYPNCEQIGNSDLLLRNLYSDRVLGLSQLEAPTNTVVTGPRGCGKTTVFRALSLKYRMSVDTDTPLDIRYIGIYYRCDDLYFSFPRYTLPSDGNGINVPMHFFVVTLVAEVLRTVRAWGRRHFGDSFSSVEAHTTTKIRSILGLRELTDPSGAKFEALISSLDGPQRKRAQRKQQHLHRESALGYCGPEALLTICAVLRDNIAFLTDRPFYFLIDDYSDPKITSSLQKNLNRLVMHRSPDVFFKLSTESPVSFSRSDIDGKAYVESREYDLLNLGLRFLKSPDDGLDFLRDLFRKRFLMVENYPVSSLSDLLGTTPRNENKLARNIRNKRQRGLYSSEETVAAMCSGDIHDVLRLVQRMVEDFGGIDALRETTDTPKIPTTSQHDSIRGAAGEFLEQVRTLPGQGERLAQIVTAFGAVAHSHLIFRDSKNQDGNPPHQASRIEPYEALKLPPMQQVCLNDLLRYSIFIEDPRGKSRRGHVVPRYYLRRYLIPHFWLTFSRRDSLELEPEELSQLLSNPEAFEKTQRLKSLYKDRGTLDLFRDNGASDD